MKTKHYLFFLLASTTLFCATPSQAQNQRVHQNFDKDWHFAFGNASDPKKDFGCGTEYFNYLTKASSIHNEGPYSNKFDDSSWRKVDLPFDWVVDLPFANEASHSHGYKTVGYKYPETSVGWYRKTFIVDKDEYGKHIELQFDGIFRDSRIWVNGFYLGGNQSGYTSKAYDISEYINYGDTNMVCVRADATLEEGWFYEGAGIYRHVWFNTTAPVYVKTFGTFVYADLNSTFDKAEISIEATIKNDALKSQSYSLKHTLIDAKGNEVGNTTYTPASDILPKQELTSISKVTLNNPHLWSVDDPYLYSVRTDVVVNGRVIDSQQTVTGIRKVEFSSERGFILNGKVVKIKGVDMHQDHPGVGAGIPDSLQVWRLQQLKKFGCNAYRASHNPATPELLDACDRLGILVMDENRLTGINDYQIGQLKEMIMRDRNHPSVILWSIGNEEWGIEWKEFGTRLAASMTEYCHLLDPTRKVSGATSGGPTYVVPLDVAGYNYIMQNPVDEHRKNYPNRCAVGTEETSGCGTRGCYFDDHANGHMTAINRHPQGSDSLLNCIERGWKFYDERPWLGGLFYWTGFDYRGEPNPLSYPATGSEFGILDYCGFPKDEAFYLKSWWTDTPTIHILPHWNLSGHEGDSIDVWVYSNAAEVELTINGKSLGRKVMPKNGHLSWKTVYSPGYIKAQGYDSKGKATISERLETTDKASRILLTANKSRLNAQGNDVAVCTIELRDKKGRFVPDACEDLTINISGPIRIIGVGNGDPAYKDDERPTDPNATKYKVRSFNGLAQVLLQTNGEVGKASISIEGVASKARLDLTAE